MFNIIFSNDWIRTADLWCCKEPLYQLSHNYSVVFNLASKYYEWNRYHYINGVRPFHQPPEYRCPLTKRDSLAEYLSDDDDDDDT